MQQAMLIRSDSPQADPRLVRGLFRLRHRVFREILQWQASSENGLEGDGLISCTAPGVATLATEAAAA